ncbi:MAG: PH domain-containing protein [Bacteroidales bacterium]|nr:PH domain-containing protein [Bacteroidales bacterium]
MGYTSRHLVPGEEIIYTGKVSPAIFISPVLLLIVGLVAVGRGITLPLENEADIELLMLAGAVCLLFGFISLIGKIFTALFTEFTITNKRCILKKGFIAIVVSDIALDKCEGMVFNQSLIGRMFGYGRIGATTGGNTQTFGGLARPFDFRNQLFVAMEEAKSKMYSRP